MKKLVLIIVVCFLSILTIAQGPSVSKYTKINTTGYNWIRGYFRALHLPAGSGAPSLQVDQWNGAGAVYLDSVANLMYYWSSGVWNEFGISGAYTDEQAQDAIGAMLSGEFTYADGTPLLSINSIAFSKITGIVPIAQGGTNLTALGSALQLLRVNSGATALEYFTADYAPGSGSANYIQNQYLAAQTANYNITGSGRLDSLFSGYYKAKIGTDSMYYNGTLNINKSAYLSGATALSLNGGINIAGPSGIYHTDGGGYYGEFHVQSVTGWHLEQQGINILEAGSTYGFDFKKKSIFQDTITTGYTVLGLADSSGRVATTQWVKNLLTYNQWIFDSRSDSAEYAAMSEPLAGNMLILNHLAIKRGSDNATFTHGYRNTTFSLDALNLVDLTQMMDSIAAHSGGSGMTIGDPVTGSTDKRVLFVDAGNLNEDASFEFDKTNNALAVGATVDNTQGVILGGKSYSGGGDFGGIITAKNTAADATGNKAAFGIKTSSAFTGTYYSAMIVAQQMTSSNTDIALTFLKWNGGGSSGELMGGFDENDAFFTGLNKEFLVDYTGNGKMTSLKVNPLAYNATTWNGDSSVVTRDDIRDKIESMLASSTRLDQIVAATASNTINNLNNTQTLQWNTISSGIGLKLESSSTNASSNSQTLFNVLLYGANSGSSQTTYAAEISNQHTGTSANNIAANIFSSGSSNASNTGANISASGSSTTLNTGVFASASSGTTAIAMKAQATGATTNIAAWFNRGYVELGTVGTESGVLKFNGSTSGTIAIQPAAAAGTWTGTLPADDGDANEVLSTNGTGVMDWIPMTGIGTGDAYTTTLSAVANVSGLTSEGVRFTVNGNVLTISGTITFTTTSTTTASEIGVTIPGAYCSSMADVDDVSGQVAFKSAIGNSGWVEADISNQRVTIKFTSGAATSTGKLTFTCSMIINNC